MSAHHALADFARDAHDATIRETSTGYRWTLDGRFSPIAWVEGEDIVVNRSVLAAVTGALLAHPLVAGLRDERDIVLLPGVRSFSRAVFEEGLTDPNDILESAGLGDPSYAAYCKAAGVAHRSLWRDGYDSGIAPEYLGALS